MNIAIDEFRVNYPTRVNKARIAYLAAALGVKAAFLQHNISVSNFLDRRFELLYVRILPEKSLRHAIPTFFINPHPVTIAQVYFNRLLGFRASEARKRLLNARVSGS